MKLGIEQLSVVIGAGVDCACAIDGLANHESIFSLLKYIHTFKDVASVSFEQLKQELLDLDADERTQLVGLVKDKLILHNKALEKKIEDGVEIFDEFVDVALDAYSIYLQTVVLVDRAKKLVE